MTNLVRLASLLVFAPFCVLAQEPGAETKRMQAVRVDTAPVIDGRLDDAVWSQARPIDDLHQTVPEEYAEPSQRSVFYLLYDDEAVYIGARLWDSEPGGVTARVLRQGDRVPSDDAIAVILSPFNDQRSGYFFVTNPNGLRVESLFQDSTQLMPDWDAIWEARSSIDENGWSAELEIPLKSLSFDPDNTDWGINFFRRVARDQEQIQWISVDRRFNAAVVGVAEGFEDLEKGVGLDIVPSLSLSQEKQYSPRMSESDSKPSLDMFYKLTPGLTGVLTLNTDFSATEVDDRQVNLTRFSLFFPEKRRFFLQDADIFQFGRIGAFGGADDNNGRPFFSRTIGLSATREPVDLEGGVKLSGKVGRWNLGVLGVRQDEFQDIDATNLFVGRVRANVLEESSLGMIFTDGDPASNLDNTVYGVDFRYLNTRRSDGRPVEADVWFQQSDTPGLDGEDKSYKVSMSRNSEEGIGGFAGYKVIEENFRPALGFVSRVGVENWEGSGYYTIRPQGRYIRSAQVRLSVNRYERLSDGSLESELIDLQALQLENNTGDRLQFNLKANKEGLIEPFEISEGVIIPAGDYEFDRYTVTLSTGGQRKFSGGIEYESGDFFGGESLRLRPYIDWRPSRHFRLSLEYQMDDVDLPEGSFVARLTRFRADIVFSSRLSWVNLLQWDNVTDTLGINSRLHWAPRSGRDVYLVLNHNMLDIDGNRTFKSQSADLTMKANYTFRF